VLATATDCVRQKSGGDGRVDEKSEALPDNHVAIDCSTRDSRRLYHCSILCTKDQRCVSETIGID
jgi:hypothetical protein